MKLWLFIVLAGFFLSGCEQKPEAWFEPTSSIRFQYKMTDEVLSRPIKTLDFSFGQIPEEILTDTLLLEIAFSGPVVAHPRLYNVLVADSGSLFPGSTTMKEGEDFWFLTEPFKIRGGMWIDTLPVVISREHMDPGFQKKETKTLILRLEKSEDFGAVIENMNEIRIVANNYLAEPSWWRADLNYYHPEKYKILMWLQPLLKNADKLEISIVELQTLIPTLKEYLQDHVILDKETGKRVLFDTLEEYVPDHVE